jgi:hypothetical protein
MAAGYSRDFLVSAFADKYEVVFENREDFLDFKIRMGYDHFDKVGKDRFRTDCSLDAEAIKQYKESLK